MEFKHDRSSNILFSLHYSRIKKITFENNTLTLKADRLFKYTEDEEKIYSGDIVFDGSDLEECRVLIFNKTVNRGYFSGKAIGMKEYIVKSSNLEFEILTEGYYGYCTTYIGWIWQKGKAPVSAIMEIWNTGDMIYRVNEEENTY